LHQLIKFHPNRTIHGPYQMAATVVTLNDLEGYSQVGGLFKYRPSNICAAFYTIATDSVLAIPLR